MADLMGFSRTAISRVYTEWCENTSFEQHFCRRKRLGNERGQRRKTGLVSADRKATVTLITTVNNRGEQKSISRPLLFLLLSGKTRNLRLVKDQVPFFSNLHLKLDLYLHLSFWVSWLCRCHMIGVNENAYTTYNIATKYQVVISHRSCHFLNYKEMSHLWFSMCFKDQTRRHLFQESSVQLNLFPSSGKSAQDVLYHVYTVKPEDRDLLRKVSI